MRFSVGDEILIVLPHNTYWGLELFNNSVQVVILVNKHYYTFEDTHSVIWNVPPECAFPPTELLKVLL